MTDNRRLSALFAVAIVGVVVVLALALKPLGPVVLVFYLALVVYAVSKAVRRVRDLQQPAGKTCTCCTSTVYDPVEVR